MPAIVGTVNINSLEGVLNVGDVHTISPTGYFKTFAGGGSFNSGDTLNVNNGPSVIHVYGTDAFEQTSLLPENKFPQVGGDPR